MGPENVYIYIISYSKYHTKSDIFRKNHKWDIDFSLYNSSIKKKLILIDLRFVHHIAYFCSISPTKNGSKYSRSTVLRLWAHDGVLFLVLNESTI